jgi:hypothetical protein
LRSGDTKSIGIPRIDRIELARPATPSFARSFGAQDRPELIEVTYREAKESEAKLRTWMETKGLVADDSAESSGVETAGYDPRFTPGALRRNEVQIRLKKHEPPPGLNLAPRS